MNLFDLVQLTEDLPEERLPAGTLGTIVHVFQSPRLAYEVEFVDSRGATVAIATLTPDKIQHASS